MSDLTSQNLFLFSKIPDDIKSTFLRGNTIINYGQQGLKTDFGAFS